MDIVAFIQWASWKCVWTYSGLSDFICVQIPTLSNSLRFQRYPNQRHLEQNSTVISVIYPLDRWFPGSPSTSPKLTARTGVVAPSLKTVGASKRILLVKHQHLNTSGLRNHDEIMMSTIQFRDVKFHIASSSPPPFLATHLDGISPETEPRTEARPPPPPQKSLAPTRVVAWHWGMAQVGNG